jgi:hypothetical protein
MSLRDYFAGQAFAGWMATNNDTQPIRLIAEMCYGVADGMLKAREQ